MAPKNFSELAKNGHYPRAGARSATASALAVLADPHRYVGGLQGLERDGRQVVPDRVQVHRVFEAGGEGGHGSGRRRTGHG